MRSTSKLRILSLIHLLIVPIAMCGCSRLSPDEQLLKDAFTCIKQKDYDHYKSLTITSADFELKHSNTSPFKAKMGYVGGLLKPQLQEQQEKQFQKAVDGGNGIIDFAACQYTGAIKKAEDRLALIGGGDVPVRIFAVTTASTKTNAVPQPLFMVADWNGKPRIMQLIFEKQP